MPDDERTEQGRRFLKDTIRKEINFRATDQGRGVPPPPAQKPCPADARRVDLVPPGQFRKISKIALSDAIRHRESRREYARDPLSLEELSFLLWATQGIRETMNDVATFRTVPSAGARHSFETYIYARRVDTLGDGVYRYLPAEHQLAMAFKEPTFGDRLGEACFSQDWVGKAAAVFVWTAIPYRTEWRYGLAAHKVIAIDIGHVGQNLYLACEAIRGGTCMVGAYDQEKMDALLRVDGKDEFVIYLAPVGKRKH
ncbi:MAG: SagB/ThcOx family dehydrogenase [Kiritimatiellae bacterium]|nr:SagB/ThcOx family dehydrogenase [Kiritimatiellia bacterium]